MIPPADHASITHCTVIKVLKEKRGLKIFEVKGDFYEVKGIMRAQQYIDLS